MARAPQLSPDGKFYWSGQAWTRMPSDPSPSVFGRAFGAVRKALVPTVGGNPDPATEQSMAQQGMGWTRPFSPGRPLNPYFGFSADPRQFDFQTGENITVRPRHNRVSFDTLRQMTMNYDVARMCIARRIDSFRSFEWTIVPQDGNSTGLKDEIAEARRRIAKPDGRTPYSSWIAMYLENLFRYDAPAVFRRRNRGGAVIGLEIVDGSSIAPLLDEYGRPPAAPAPAFMQFANGVPWDWLTVNDLIYQPYRPQPDSPYGLAPLETVLLTANTDLRLQQHLLEQWTEGNIAAGTMEAPEDLSSAAEVEEFQDTWDADTEGDQAVKRKIRWVPHGANYKPMYDGKFDEPAALWLLRKCCAAYSVVPQDLGLTMDVNRASGDTQVDIQERIADRPLALHIDGVMTTYLQEDCGLPVKMQTSLSAEKEDRKTEAEAWAIYIDKGMASADEGRQKILGLEVDNERPVPRMFLNPRTGPIPLASLFEIAGPIDPETAAPSEDLPLDAQPFDGAGATLPDKLPGGTQFKRAPINPDDPNFPQNEKLRPETGAITSPAQALTPPAAAAPAVPPPPTAVRKDANKGLIAAGLVVRAADTGRVLMLQRSLDETDPAAGTWEWPGGHIEADESAWQAAVREWQEETGSTLPQGEQLGGWTVGVYQGFLVEIPHETDLQINQQAGRVINADDPDGDRIEVAAWFDPAHARAMPALRPECKTTDWELLCNWVPIRKAETAGITAETALDGYDLSGEDPDEDIDEGRDGDNEMGDGVHEAFTQAVQKELRRWRNNARTRVKAGKPPRTFISDALPAAVVKSVWSKLKAARSREDVDAAFVRKSRMGADLREVSDAVLAGLAPELDELGRLEKELDEAKRNLRDQTLLNAVQKAARPDPVIVQVPSALAPEVHVDVAAPTVHVEAPQTPVQKADVPQIHVDVHVPEQKAPEVHVHNQIQPEPKAKKTTFKRNPDGSTTVIRED